MLNLCLVISIFCLTGVGSTQVRAELRSLLGSQGNGRFTQTGELKNVLVGDAALAGFFAGQTNSFIDAFKLSGFGSVNNLLGQNLALDALLSGTEQTLSHDTLLNGLDVGQILSGGLNNPTLLALVSNILSSLFSGGIDVNRITGGAVGLDLVLQEAIRNVLGVLDQRQLSSSFLGGSSSSGGSTNGLQQIFTIFDGRLDALGLANVEATLRALLSLNGVGNRLFNAGRTEDGEILSEIAGLLDFTDSDPGFSFTNIKKLAKLGRRIRKIAGRDRLLSLLQESGMANSATILNRLAVLSDLEDLLNIRTLIAPVVFRSSSSSSSSTSGSGERCNPMEGVLVAVTSTLTNASTVGEVKSILENVEAQLRQYLYARYNQEQDYEAAGQRGTFGSSLII